MPTSDAVSDNCLWVISDPTNRRATVFMILFQDVDGCLNTPDGSVLDFTTAILTDQQQKAFRDFGALLDSSAVDILVINTGRSWPATKFICDAINSSKIRYALTEHASELWDVKANISLDLLQMSDKLGMHEIRDAQESVLRVRELISWFDSTGNRLVASSVGYSGIFHYLRDKTSNLTIQVPQDVDGDDLLSSLKASIESEGAFESDIFVFHYSRAFGLVDVMGQVDKGMGVKVLTKFLGGSTADTYAVGDGLNDLPMLHAVNYPICPANAEPEVQDFCKVNGLVSNSSYIGAVTSWLSQVDN